ncbi:sialate O-acetylesterase [Paenibacillus piri]|uniref:Sialate O-acetylesterase n=1 Tax=Paenibacillus piri TaxID=2547395 RepID=A0A4R5K9I7_9BACL|nr:sialate O-acetylesterase [Paenibacillus piri]TDF91823.1 sialate O-acetylesterase [Paenibacillus piri]
MTRNLTKIELPRLISDGMVIQRNAQVSIWGWAPAGEVIAVHFMGNSYSAAVDANGEWRVRLQTANAGGPYDMAIETDEGAERMIIKDILLGDVWLCSGQSNMEMKMQSLRDVYPEEIAQAGNDFIRQFLIPVKYDFERPRTDVEAGCWEAANPQSVLSFSAAGYFYASKLFETYRVPVGLINASLGGAPVESFMSEDALSLFPDYIETLQKMKNKNDVEAMVKEDLVSREEWYRNVNRNDAGLSDAGKPCFHPDFDATDWPYIRMPSYWEEEGLGHFNGVVWFRKEIEIPPSLLGNSATLFLGNVVDEDTVYINGTMVGTKPNQYVPRAYDIPAGLLQEGRNTVVVRVVNFSGKGGFYKGKPYHLRTGDRITDLSGEWQYLIGVKSEPLPAPAFVQWRPSGLYNGMIGPVVRYAIKGVAWYQGESNAKKPEKYESLFKALIADWRKKWGLGDIPFLYVQLPNYMEPSDRPAAGKWAALREAQRKTLAVPNTGMAVTIDIGEWNDVHPRNKKDVGTRLALAARKVAYGDEAVVASGPMLRSAKIDGNRIILSFDDRGSGLVAKGGDRLRHFAIAGADRSFVWADARIEDECVAVWHSRVPNPIYVRYAWADNPEGANLYNREGLPASPFTTESLK